MRRIVAFTGAGVSKASGVPTFEEMGDIRDKLSRSYFIGHPADFYKILLEMKKTTDKAKPNPAHLAIAKYDLPVVTMNIDGLHARAGTKELVEIHGDMEKVCCPKCRGQYEFNIVEDTIYCPKCGTLLEPRVVLYEDPLDRYCDAAKLILSGEELLVVGTSFQTSTASQMVNQARWAGIKVTVINSDAQIQVPKYLEESSI